MSSRWNGPNTGPLNDHPNSPLRIQSSWKSTWPHTKASASVAKRERNAPEPDRWQGDEHAEQHRRGNRADECQEPGKVVASDQRARKEAGTRDERGLREADHPTERR